jgi:hypothetical protein
MDDPLNSISTTMTRDNRFLSSAGEYTSPEFQQHLGRNTIRSTQVFFRSIVSMLPNKALMFLRQHQAVILVQAVFC